MSGCRAWDGAGETNGTGADDWLGNGWWGFRGWRGAAAGRRRSVVSTGEAMLSCEDLRERGGIGGRSEEVGLERHRRGTRAERGDRSLGRAGWRSQGCAGGGEGVRK